MAAKGPRENIKNVQLIKRQNSKNPLGGTIKWQRKMKIKKTRK